MNYILAPLNKRSLHLALVVVMSLLSGGVLLPTRANAQKLVVASFSSRKARRLAKQARAQLLRALDNKGVRLISYRQYLRRARRLRLRGRRALKPWGIARVARKMRLDGVITGSAVRRGRRYHLIVRAYDSNGRRIVSKAYRLRRPALPAANAGKLAAIIVSKLGGGTAVAVGNSATPEPAPEPASKPAVENPPTTPPSSPASSSLPDSALPAWARNQPGETTGQPATGGADSSAAPATEATAETSASATLRIKKKVKTGSVPDILLAAGMSGNLRAGLHPRHESGLYPGVRVDARVFMGSFLDVPVVRDLAVGGLFNMGLGLKYGLQGDGEQWSSTMMQWQAELTYRLALDVHMQPAFLLRVGYGATINTIDTTNSAAISAGYFYPYAALDIYLTLWQPYLRLFAGGGYLFLVSGSKDVSGSGWGFTVRGGLDVVLWEMLHAGLGYEMWQFDSLEVTGTGVSDTFQSFFLRVGWNYH